MIPFIAIGDPHISDRHMSMTTEAMNTTYELVSRRKDIPFVVVMGDVFDRHNNLKLEHMKLAFDWLKKLSSITRTYVLVGNHDRVNNKDFLSQVHPYMGWNGIEKLHIIDRPHIIQYGDRYRICFMPYVPPGRFKEAIDIYISAKHKRGEMLNVKSVKDIDLIFAHQEFHNSPCGPILSVRGDKWDVSYPMVISGHIHTRMRLQDNIFYTGSLYPITTSENNDKGVIIGNYNPSNRKLDVVVTCVVSSRKEVHRFKASDSDQVSEMVALDRKNAKYVVQGTPDEIASIKQKVKGKDLNIVYDIRPSPAKISQSATFGDILSSLLQDQKLRDVLAELD